MRRIALLLAGLLLLPAAAIAAKPEPGGTIAIDPSSDLRYGGFVTFDVTMTRVKYPRVQVLCYQDDELVQGMAGSPSYVFRLGGVGTDWTGGPAECCADLYYFWWHGQEAGATILDSVAFTAEG